jgi:hypothetical protein
MSRDQLVQDNWALLYAQEVAEARKVPMAVVFNLVSDFPGANLRHYHFMMQGLAELEQELQRLSVPFFLLQGDPAATVPAFAERNRASLVVMDFSPLRIGQVWRTQLSSALQKQLPGCSLAEVDAHNVVPCWVASDKKEYGARTIRRKINDKLPEFLTEFPLVVTPAVPWPAKSPDQPAEAIDWAGLLDAMAGLDRSVGVVDWCTPVRHHTLIASSVISTHKSNKCLHTLGGDRGPREPERLPRPQAQDFRRQAQRPVREGPVERLALATLRPNRRAAMRTRSQAPEEEPLRVG